MGQMENRPEPAQLRVSDDDRHKVAEILREAAGEGRLDLDELDERLEATYAAKTYADLVPITIDLPAQGTGSSTPVARPAASPAQPLPTESYTSSVAVMSTVKRQGLWLVPESSTSMAFMGEIELDLRSATLAASEVVINASAIMGSVKVIVDAHTRVELQGVPIMGEFKQGKDKVEAQLDASSPVVRIKGMALMGSVLVVRRPPAGTPRRYFGHH